MNAPSSLSPQEKALCQIFALKRALAGDLECVEPLEILEARVRAIDWNDPAFIEATRQMSSGVPELSPGQAAALQPELLDLLNSALERINRDNEIFAAQGPLMQQSIEALKLSITVSREATERAKQTGRLIAFIGHALDVHERMRDRLEMLGDDISAYNLPNLDA